MIKPGMIVAYNEAYDIVAMKPLAPRNDAAGNPDGFWDLAWIEESGEQMTRVWIVNLHTHDPVTGEIISTTPARGSKFWPEWLDTADLTGMKVELAGPPGSKQIVALVNPTSGYRRERADIEEAITARVVASEELGVIPDLRDLVGGPDHPLRISPEALGGIDDA